MTDNTITNLSELNLPFYTYHDSIEAVTGPDFEEECEVVIAKQSTMVDVNKLTPAEKEEKLRRTALIYSNAQDKASRCYTINLSKDLLNLQQANKSFLSIGKSVDNPALGF